MPAIWASFRNKMIDDAMISNFLQPQSSIGVRPSCRRPHIASKTVAARVIIEDELTMKSTPVRLLRLVAMLHATFTSFHFIRREIIVP
jgi:hypothetical protein